ncbi:MAG: response regulator [Candidatus Aquilonibacter sp.]
MASVLVVDDNAINLDLMLYLLRALGHEAHGTADALAGLDAARSRAFDIVLTDILMPGMDGHEFVRRLRADTAVRLPVVAVTALAMPEDRARIANAGFEGYIGKPIEPRTFVAQVESFLRDHV